MVHVFETIARSLNEGFFMFWETLWALVLGFGLSGAVQAFVSRGEIRRVLGNHSPKVVARASFLGMVSSSCSYAASALAKSLFAGGADFTSAMIFMFASTNLVVELGAVLWLLMGWQFALAEFVGGAIMIVLLALVLPRVIPTTELEAARSRLQHVGDSDHEHGEPDPTLVSRPLGQRIRSLAGWSDAASYTMSDLTMLRKELVLGFVIAGFASVAVPTAFWQSLFITGHGLWSSIENVLLGPLLAIISFVCSIGNVPLAAALWKGGSSFGGVISFVFADLITLPLLAIYRKYYGTPLTVRLLVVFWLIMSIAGFATEYLFKALAIVPTIHPAAIASTGFRWDYTAILDILALMIFATLFALSRNRPSEAASAYAKDIICGMQVEKGSAPARTAYAGKTLYFCSDRCHERFLKNPTKHVRDAHVQAEPAPSDHPGHVDPVCGMTVTSATLSAQVAGQTCWFCCAGCLDAFIASPERYQSQANPERVST